jgi:anti-sigma B factor antagonist
VDGRSPLLRGLLRIEKTTDGPSFTLSLHGEIDLSNVHRAERELHSLDAGRRHERVILDMTGLEFIDSAGIAWLVREIRRANGNGRLQVRGVTPSVRRVLSLTGVEEMLPYADEPS